MTNKKAIFLITAALSLSVLGCSPADPEREEAQDYSEPSSMSTQHCLNTRNLSTAKKLTGLFLGLLPAVPTGVLVCRATITTIGIRIPTKLPLLWWSLCTAAVLLLLMGFVFWQTGKVGKVTPMKAIRRESENLYRQPRRVLSVPGKALHLRLALRQHLTWKRRYLGALLVAGILVFFASLAGRMDSWLGPDGKGMMNAFNLAGGKNFR